MTAARKLRWSASRLVIAAVLPVLALAACKPNAQQAASSAPPPLAALPLSDSAAPPITPAPPVSALPPAPRARVARLADPNQEYAFADRAYAMASAFGDAPPDYAFDYGNGERPWVWMGDDQSMRVAEPLPGGYERYYYYEPGSDTPYLVTDGDYSYGYDGGALVVVYDRRGHRLPPDEMERRAQFAGQYLARSQAIYQASRRQQREAVAQANWAARRSAIDAQRAQWAAAQAADQDWRAYHDAHQQDEQAHWAAERYRREAQAARFAQAVNDQQLAQQDWQAAQRAQARAAAAGQIPAPGGGPFHFGQKPPPVTAQAPPVQPPPGQAAPGQAIPGQAPIGPGTRVQPNGPPPSQSQPGAFQADAQRRAAEQAQAAAASRQAAAQQAQVEAQRRGQLQSQAEAARQAQTQAAAAQRTQLEAQRRADQQAQVQAAAARQAQAQAAAAQRAQLEAQRRAEQQAQIQARTQAAAAQRAQLEAQRRADQQAQVQARAQAAAARQAQAQHQAQVQAQAQAQAARQAQQNAAAQAARERAATKPAKPEPTPHPRRVGPNGEPLPANN